MHGKQLEYIIRSTRLSLPAAWTMPLLWLNADELHRHCAGARAEKQVVPAIGRSWLAVVVHVVLRVVGQFVQRTV